MQPWPHTLKSVRREVRQFFIVSYIPQYPPHLQPAGYHGDCLRWFNSVEAGLECSPKLVLCRLAHACIPSWGVPWVVHVCGDDDISHLICIPAYSYSYHMCHWPVNLRPESAWSSINNDLGGVAQHLCPPLCACQKCLHLPQHRTLALRYDTRTDPPCTRSETMETIYIYIVTEVWVEEVVIRTSGWWVIVVSM